MYWADGAGSRAVFESLQDLLGELRGIVCSDRALALYHPSAAAGRGHFVLSDSSQSTVEEALANERLLLNQTLDLTEPSTVAGLVATSTLRDFRVAFNSALVIPWVDPFGRGAVLIGLNDEQLATRSLQELDLAADQQRLIGVLSQSRMNGTLSLQRQLSGALREVLSGTDSGEGPVTRLGSLVKAARSLFRTDTAYLALPETPTGTNYFFASLSNVHTSPFRALRMEFGQGLGGLARTEGKVVSSLNYSEDERLKAAPVIETGGEGIVSAMAAPLMRGSTMQGVLYVGSRSPRPFSPTDELLLGEFADYIGLLMDQPGFTAATKAAHVDRMREDFAHAIHDSVVRSLVQIGFTAEQAARTASGATDAASIDLIRKAAEEALTNLREELSGLVAETSVDSFELSDVLGRMVDVPSRPGMQRDIVILGNAAETSVSARVAEVLIHVGAEAVTNSTRHAGATTQTIEAATTDTDVVVRIIDDGHGSPILGLSAAQLSAMGHLGVASMHRRVEAVGGTLSIQSSVDDGTSVTACVPADRGAP